MQNSNWIPRYVCIYSLLAINVYVHEMESIYLKELLVPNPI